MCNKSISFSDIEIDAFPSDQSVNYDKDTGRLALFNGDLVSFVGWHDKKLSYLIEFKN